MPPYRKPSVTNARQNVTLAKSLAATSRKAAPAASQPAALQQAVADPRRATPAIIRELQGRYGNRAVQRLIQAKLSVGPARDRYEQEAEQTATRVVRMEAARGRAASGRPEAGAAAPALTQLQRSSAGAGFEASPPIEQRLAARTGQGSPLPDGVRTRMEQGLGASFDGVRIHADGEAAQLSQSLQAQAFTHGQDIYMGAGKFSPASTQGQHLLAHELTHVVQQTGGVQRQAEPEAQPAAGAGKALIQRFPANVLSSPINWSAEEFSVRLTASGAMGGVNVFQSTRAAPGGVSTVVVEGLVPDENGRLKPGNLPNSRQVPAGTPEFAQLARVLDLPLDQDGVAHARGDRTIQAFRVMESMPAQSLGDETAEAQTEEDMDRLVDLLVRPELLHLVGRLAVADGALGNFDRITSEGLKFGEIMVSAPQASAQLRVWATDTAASLPVLEAKILERVAETGGAGASPEMLKKLFERGPRDLAARFVDALSMNMIDAQSLALQAPSEDEQTDLMQDSPRAQKLAAYLAGNLMAVRPEMIGYITKGYNDGVRRLMTLLGGGNQTGPEREAAQAAEETEHSWESLKAHTRYMQLRSAHGMDHLTAAEYVKPYAQYRLLRATNIPTPTAADPTRFADLQFPAILLKGQPLSARAETKPNLNQDENRAAAKFYSDIKVFTTDLDKQMSDLNRIESPAEFSLSLMQAEIQADQANQGQPGPQRGAVAPGGVQDFKRRSLLMKQVSDLYKTSLSILAYGEVYKVKGQSFVPSLLKLKNGALREYGPKLSVEMGTLSKQMETIKRLHRRLEAHVEMRAT